MKNLDVGRRSLAPAALHILLALSAQSSHGYGIMKEVERQSGGQYRLGPGTLYDNLRKLIQDGLVEDVPLGIESDSKRMYRITANGARLLASEMKTLEEIVRIGRRRLRSLQMA